MGRSKTVADTDTDQGNTGEGTGEPEGNTPDPAEGAGDGAVDFKADAEKWKALARKHETRAKANEQAAKRLAEIEDASKSDIERATTAAAEAQKRAEAAELKALRYEIATEKQLPSNLVKFLTGTDEDDIRAAADELLAAVAPADKGGSSTGKPKEALRSGATSEEGEPVEMDPAKLAADIPRM
jgi:hypothetical protein